MSAAYAAARFNPELRAFFQKLKARGLKPKQAIAAVARKLLMLAWAIARNTLQNKPVYYPGGIKKSRNAKIYCPTT